MRWIALLLALLLPIAAAAQTQTPGTAPVTQTAPPGVPASGGTFTGGINAPSLGAVTPGSVAATTLSASGLISPTSAIGIQGTVTNDNPIAGSVGEVMTANSTANTATVTFTGTTTNLVNWTAHGLVAGTSVYFTTTGSLPSGISASTNYFVTAGATLTTNSFQLSTTVVNAFAGTALALTTNGTATTTGIAGAIMTSGSPANIVALNPTAGDWNCWGGVELSAGSGTTITFLEGGIGTSTAAFVPIYSGGATAFFSDPFTTSTASGFSVGTVRVSQASTAPVYLIGSATFGTSTMNGYGTMTCRRAR
jgi:hypothetical protein